MKTLHQSLKKGFLLVVAVTFFACQPVEGQQKNNANEFNRHDILIAEGITKLLDGQSLPLNFPNTVKSFYKQGDCLPVWIKPLTSPKKTWEGMLLIDCVLQFGLSHDDYHPKDLRYDKLHEMLEQPSKTDAMTKARFDVLLTDALLTFINHLHFGKLNPQYSLSRLDEQATAGFSAQLVLRKALREKQMMSVILDAQPKLPEYIALQKQMRLLTGQLADDCYDIPEADIRKVAINMERLRWLNSNDQTYIHINIPSYTLKFYQPDTVYQFRVIVGKPANATPTLQSTVKYFTTAPDWKVPAKIFAKEVLPKALRDSTYLERNQFAIYSSNGQYVTTDKNSLEMIARQPGKYYARQSSGCDNALGLLVFRFDNPYSIYLHDTPEKKPFSRKQRALSHGCIRLDKADEFARLLLANDKATTTNAFNRALKLQQTRTFNLKKAVPLKITYLTCEVVDGMLVTYDDIYQKDAALEDALYNISELITRN